MAFIDRIVEHPGRYILTNVDTGTVLGTFDLVRAEGEEYEPGTLLNANNLNILTQLDANVETLFETAGMSAGDYQNNMSDALSFLLDAMEYKTSGNWNYLLLGETFIGVYSTTGTFSINSAVGSVYQTAANSTISYPITLNKLYYANVAVSTSSYSVWSTIYSSSTSGIAYRVLSTLSRASASYAIKAIVIGAVS